MPNGGKHFKTMAAMSADERTSASSRAKHWREGRSVSSRSSSTPWLFCSRPLRVSALTPTKALRTSCTVASCSATWSASSCRANRCRTANGREPTLLTSTAATSASTFFSASVSPSNPQSSPTLASVRQCWLSTKCSRLTSTASKSERKPGQSFSIAWPKASSTSGSGVASGGCCTRLEIDVTQAGRSMKQSDERPPSDFSCCSCNSCNAPRSSGTSSRISGQSGWIMALASASRSNATAR